MFAVYQSVIQLFQLEIRRMSTDTSFPDVSSLGLTWWCEVSSWDIVRYQCQMFIMLASAAFHISSCQYMISWIRYHNISSSRFFLSCFLEWWFPCQIYCPPAMVEGMEWCSFHFFACLFKFDMSRTFQIQLAGNRFVFKYQSRCDKWFICSNLVSQRRKNVSNYIFTKEFCLLTWFDAFYHLCPFIFLTKDCFIFYCL